MFASFQRLFIEGGWVIYLIFAVSVLAWFIAIGKLFRYKIILSARKEFFKILNGKKDGTTTGMYTFDKLLSVLKTQNVSPHTVINAIDEFLVVIRPKLTSGMSTITAVIVIGPLLGLLGTITGMNEMFSVIGEFGFGNPGIMSNAISTALLATLTGLAIAVALLLFQDYLSNSMNKILNMLKNDCKEIMVDIEKKYVDTIGKIQNQKGNSMHADYRLISDEQERPDINLAPFVDTIMILLIFFVVTANLYVETGVDVSKPKAQSAVPSGQKAVLVGITREGTIHVYGRQVTLERLRLLVEKESSKQSDLSIVIVADKDVGTGRTVQVMDQCALGGAKKISIAAGKE